MHLADAFIQSNFGLYIFIYQYVYINSNENNEISEPTHRSLIKMLI